MTWGLPELRDKERSTREAKCSRLGGEPNARGHQGSTQAISCARYRSDAPIDAAIVAAVMSRRLKGLTVQ